MYSFNQGENCFEFKYFTVYLFLLKKRSKMKSKVNIPGEFLNLFIRMIFLSIRWNSFFFKRFLLYYYLLCFYCDYYFLDLQHDASLRQIPSSRKQILFIIFCFLLLNTLIPTLKCNIMTY